jgi:hypothetical protein
MGRTRAGLVAVVALTLLASACGSAATATTTSGPPRLSLPLNDAVATRQGTVAAFPMGHLDDPLNTFWQTFVLAGTGGRWALRTPTGVADNGGLVVAADGARTVVGFRTSQLLRFSPLALTEDAGKRYTSAVVSAGLGDDPDALGLGSGGSTVALTQSGVMTSSAGLAGWHTVATRSSIRATPAGRSCDLQALTAVASGPEGAVVGGSCARSGVVGLFDIVGAQAHLAGPRLSPSATDQRSEVVRAVTYRNRLALLFELAGRSSTTLVAAWQRPGGGWTLSSSLAVTGPLTATAVTSRGGFVILSADRVVEAVTGADEKSWTPLPAAPQGTEVVAATGSRFDALSVHAGTMTDYRLSARRWVDSGRVQVHIDYGSSS